MQTNQGCISTHQRSAVSSFEQVIPGVYVLPPVLGISDIAQILRVPGVRAHHDDGDHMGLEKQNCLPWVAQLIWPHVEHLRLDRMRPHSVDERMKLYRLQAGAGVVTPHRDLDFDGVSQSRALYSILLYLNDSFSGGETVFNGTMLAPHSEVGGGLLFRHDILHEGLVVQSGEKIVLKTDLFLVNA